MSDSDYLLDIFRRLTSPEFRALCLARDLPNSGTHADERAPGKMDIAVIKTLVGRGLLEANPVRPRFFVLSPEGKRLMGVIHFEQEGKRLPGFEDA